MPTSRSRRHNNSNNNNNNSDNTEDDLGKNKIDEMESNTINTSSSSSSSSNNNNNNDNSNNTEDKKSNQLIISSVQDLKGDKNMKYTHGQVVWAKFSNYPWWPGTVHLTRKDKGGQKEITVHWFGDFGQQRDDCARNKILLFDPQLKDIIFKEVQKADHASFEASVAEATRVWRELREENGNIMDNGPTIVIKNNEASTNSGGGVEEGISNRPSRKRRLSRHGLTTPSANGKGGNNETTNILETPRGRRVSQRLSGQSVNEDSQNDKEKEKEKKETNMESGSNSIRRSGRLQGKDVRAEATLKRTRCLEVTSETHDPNDLSVFIAHQYYSYMEDGKNSNDAVALVADKWNLDGDAVLEHIAAHEFESNKPSHKRRRAS